MKLNSGVSRALLVLIAPFCTLVLYALTSRFPLHVLEFPDPDFNFLFSSLGLVHGEAPVNVEYPGTPLQVLGAIVMAIRFFLFGTEEGIASDFLRHPVEYHQFLLCFTGSCFLFAQWFCGRRLLRLGIPFPVVLFAQLSPLLVWDGVVYLDHTSPETLLSAAGLCLVPLLAESSQHDPNGEKIRANATGVLLALMAGLKISTLPMAALIFLLPRPKDWLTAATAFVISLLAVTAPIWPSLPRLFRLFMAQQSSSAETSFVAIATNASDPDLILRAAPLLVALWSLFLIRFLQRRDPSAQTRWPLIFVGVVVLFLILRSPASRHFLALSPIAALAVIQVARQAGAHRMGLLLATAVAVAVAFPNRLLAQIEIRARAAENIGKLQTLLSEKYRDCHVTILDDVGIPPYSLYAGNRATRRERFAWDLSAAYPRNTFRKTGVPAFRTFGRTLNDAAWAAAALRGPCLVLVGRQKNADELFHDTFHVPPLLLDTVGEPAYFTVLGLPPAVEESFRALVPANTKGRVPRRNSP